MKKALFLILFLSQTSFAQLGLADNYQFNLLAINPAFTGQRGNWGVTGMLGNQFNGTIRPNQISQIIALDGKVGTKNASFGFQGYRSNTGGFTNTGMSLSYGNAIELDEIKILLGLNPGFSVTPNYTGVQNIGQRFSPYIGPGISLMLKNAFLGFSAPTLFAEEDFINTASKPIYMMAGYRYGSYENIAVNFSTVLGLDRGIDAPNFVHLNPKVWIANKVGIGASFRFQSNSSKKVIPTAEYRVSETSTFGLSYDSKPPNLTFANTNIKATGVFQLLYRYDVFKRGEKSPFLNQF